MQSHSGNDTKGIWTIIIILFFLFSLFLLSAVFIGNALSSDTSDSKKIGVVEITGPIASADEVVKQLRDFDKDETIKGILVRVDSPGGAIGASQEMREAIMHLKKKCVISMGNIAASGGLYVSMTGHPVYASAGTITGSIGVISQFTQINEMLDFLKIKVNTVKTGTLKDSGSPFRDFTDVDRIYFTNLQNDLYNQFVDDIVNARKIEKSAVLKIADGRVLSGKQALEHKLIDEIGGFDRAIERLRQDLKISADESIELVYPEDPMRKLTEIFFKSGVESIKNEISRTIDNRGSSNGFYYLYRP